MPNKSKQIPIERMREIADKLSETHDLLVRLSVELHNTKHPTLRRAARAAQSANLKLDQMRTALEEASICGEHLHRRHFVRVHSARPHAFICGVCSHRSETAELMNGHRCEFDPSAEAEKPTV